jgi:Skp family chaperone for outer membrane proteins
VVGALLLSGRSWSDVKKAEPRPHTRIGLVNLSYVINNYEKIKTYREEMKKVIEPFSTKQSKIKGDAEKLLKESKDENTTEERKTEIEGELKKLQRDMEDLKNEFQRVMNKKQEQQAKIVYKDVEEAVRRYAKAQNIELVLHYNDATKEAERDAPANIVRKMQAGACMPIYAAPGIDISEAILANLNANLRRREAQRSGPSTTDGKKKRQGEKG